MASTESSATSTLVLIDKLLLQTRSLHESSLLSLCQLVPVHASLLEVLVVNDVSRTTRNAITSQLGEEEENVSVIQEQVFHHIQKQQQPKQTLLLLQYLFLLHKNDPLVCLESVVFSFLLLVDNTPTKKLNEKEDDINDANDDEDEELMQAVLDAVFFGDTPQQCDASALQACLQACHCQATSLSSSSSSSSSSRRFRLACRVLVRLFDWIVVVDVVQAPPSSSSPSSALFDASNQQQKKHAVLQAVTDQVILGIQEAIRIVATAATTTSSSSSLKESQNSLSHFLQPIHNDLLSLLLLGVDHDDNNDDGNNATSAVNNKKYLEEIWCFVWKLYQQQEHTTTTSNHSKTGVLVVTTTVLCSVLPFIKKNRKRVVVAVDDDVDDVDSSFSLLWDLIYQCLSRGLQVPKTLSWVQESWAKEHATKEDDANDNDGSSVGDTTNAGTSQLLRRRGLYLLRILVEEDEDYDNQQQQLFQLWNMYLACFETIEMELTPHLVDQVWETLALVCSETIADDNGIDNNDDNGSSGIDNNTTKSPNTATMPPPPPVSWKWIKVLLARVVTSAEKPALRKLSLYRLFTGQAGILISNTARIASASSNSNGDIGVSGSGPVEQQQQQLQQDGTTTTTTKKSKTRNRPAKASSGERGAPLSIVSNDFVLEAVLLAFDTLESSVGSMIHLEGDRIEIKQDMNELLATFLDAYLGTLAGNEKKCQEFFHGLWSADIMCRMSRKTAVRAFSSIAKSLQQKQRHVCIPISQDSLEALNLSLHSLLSLGSIILAYRETLLESIATILAHSKPVGQLAPNVILKTLSLFPVPERQDANKKGNNDDGLLVVVERDATFSCLKQWLSSVARDSPSWGPTVGSIIATAFVDGMFSTSTTASWNPLDGTPTSDIALGKAVVFFCTLTTYSKEKKGDNSALGESLWPAIHKGIANVPAAMAVLSGTTTAWPKADRISRALLLLEYGCKLQVISGMGNGDLIVDRKTGQMMPPPPNIEALLGNSVAFVINHIQFLLPSKEAQSVEAKVLSSTFAALIGQLQTLHEGFPSSMAVSSAVDSILNESVKAISVGSSAEESTDSVPRIAIVYAALSCGGELESADLVDTASTLMNLRFDDSRASSVSNQAARSVFEYAKWGALSQLLPLLLDRTTGKIDKTGAFVDSLFDAATESVQSAPAHALVPLFRCVLTAAQSRFSLTESGASLSEDNICHLEKVIVALVGVMDDCKSSGDSAYMLDEICALVFQPELLLDEAQRLRKNPSSSTPVLNAFRGFVEMAGRQRSQITEAVLCRVVGGWLGPTKGDFGHSVAAIPYREYITDLLLHKEERLEDSSINQNIGRRKQSAEIAALPKGTDESSVARGFLLVFLSELPDVDAGLPKIVLSDLLDPVILRLLDEVRPLKQGQLVMLGSTEFCRKMRGWQALCILSRFVTDAIDKTVCNKVFIAIGEQLHGQIRYFIEIFTIQCARRHPAVFGKALIEQMTRSDLTVQQVSSLMVISGNLIVGRYRGDFFRQYEIESDNVAKLNLVLSGVIPWLGSTQGFTRAIAQLLVFKLIPMVVDLDAALTGPGTEDSNWYLRSIYHFLESNLEMKRLRKKQSKFFEGYEVDDVCTPEGILGIPVDEGGEAFPITLVDAMKESLREVFEESQDHSTPMWKQVQDIISAQNPAFSKSDTANNSSSNGEVNFQRKIIPVDALNLALEDMQERRLRNRAGRKKQRLIVCATFIDKVPNLGGLARTAEIFAAERLVIPDMRFSKMDNFKNLSVGASDWIEIEECKEENLLAWLRARKKEGYFVVGLEQTSSSVSLTNYNFPDRPIVLLLGKEKEGIPVDFLQAVDQCVEIPQLGIIRSLNVHVSGAIAIWEQTRQKMTNGKL